MSAQNKVSGVVLAGGQARRMQQQDKGLVLFNGRPLVSYALTALEPLVDEVLISANRNQALYSRFGYPVLGDNRPGFDGPLAGILAAMQSARNSLLLVTPCDSPLINSMHLERLLLGLQKELMRRLPLMGRGCIRCLWRLDANYSQIYKIIYTAANVSSKFGCSSRTGRKWTLAMCRIFSSISIP